MQIKLWETDMYCTDSLDRTTFLFLCCVIGLIIYALTFIAVLEDTQQTKLLAETQEIQNVYIKQEYLRCVKDQ